MQEDLSLDYFRLVICIIDTDHIRPMKPYLKYLESSTKIFIVPFKISSVVLAFFHHQLLLFLVQFEVLCRGWFLLGFLLLCLVIKKFLQLIKNVLCILYFLHFLTKLLSSVRTHQLLFNLLK